MSRRRNDITRLNACQIPHTQLTRLSTHVYQKKACVPPMKGYKLGVELYLEPILAKNRYPGIRGTRRYAI
jgi:hypothetical protein